MESLDRIKQIIKTGNNMDEGHEGTIRNSMHQNSEESYDWKRSIKC